MDSLQKVKKKLAAVTTAVQAVETQEEGFLEQVGTVRRKIEVTVHNPGPPFQEDNRAALPPGREDQELDDRPC